MQDEQIIQGRRLGLKEMGLIRHWLLTKPEWNRSRLSRELCLEWNWRNGAGDIKDMACRNLLLKLERRGLIRLPARKGLANPNAFRNRSREAVVCEQALMEGILCDLQPLRIEALGRAHPDLSLFRSLLQAHHYLGLQNIVGENLKYLVRDHDGRPLACLLFGSAAWKARSRDEWIGWTVRQREHALPYMANNTRFLILPWVRVPHLASHVLGQVARRLNRDWSAKYGHGIVLLETFVQRDRFLGTCYRAAGWVHVGATTGRSRNDRNQTLSVPVKDVYVRPLAADFRRRLCA